MKLFIHLFVVFGTLGGISAFGGTLENIHSKKLTAISTVNANDSLLNRKKSIKDLASKTSLSYTLQKENIKNLRINLQKNWVGGQISLDSVRGIFTDQLVNHLIPNWYGTKWSFNGHTSTPKKGEIACGYFVSTTLRDMGLQLNRYKLAQKSPIDEAKMISCGSEVLTISAPDTETAITQIAKSTKEGIYFIGFDKNHVGYLLKKNNEMFLIHSNYLFPNSVCIEPIEASNVFKKFLSFHIVDITYNDSLLQNWLHQSEIL